MTRPRSNADWVEAYFHWMIPQVRSDRAQVKSYVNLLQMMHDKEFVWIVPNDDNRIEDGRDLRSEFLEEKHAPYRITRELFGPISVLEVLIGVSRRASFMTGQSAPSWAWHLVLNLDFKRMSDPLSDKKREIVHQTLDALIWRTYSPDGVGGFFPLAWPEQDQTKVEIWYQMNHYVREIQPKN